MLGPTSSTKAPGTASPSGRSVTIVRRSIETRPTTFALCPSDRDFTTIAQRTHVAVGTGSRGHDARSAWAVPTASRVIANTGHGINLPNLEDAGHQRHGRLHGIGRVGRGIDAVERRARAHQVEVEVGAEEDPRGIGQRGRRAGHARDELAETLELRAVDGVGGSFGRDEVAHQQRQPQAAQAHAVVGQQHRLLGAQPQPVHAGVEMDHRVERLRDALGAGAPGGDLAEIVERRTSRCSTRSISAPGSRPLSTQIQASGAASRRAMPPSTWATKKWRQPSAHSRRPTGAAPRPQASALSTAAHSTACPGRARDRAAGASWRPRHRDRR